MEILQLIALFYYYYYFWELSDSPNSYSVLHFQHHSWIQTPSIAGRPCWCCSPLSLLDCWRSSSTSSKGLHEFRRTTSPGCHVVCRWTRTSFAFGPVRKIPWIHVQTEDSHEKEPEVISTVGPNDIMSKVKHSEFSSPKDLMDKELEARSRGRQKAIKK